jgi:hypothetical protein
MGFVMPEMVIQKVLQGGIRQLKLNKAAFIDIFSMLVEPGLASDYGENYREQVWQWFVTAKIPVVQAWSFNVSRVPSLSVKSSVEQEDESKAALYDLIDENEDGEVKTAVFNVSVDIGVHANRTGDHVLWLYYITAYLLFKYKAEIEKYGIHLSTFSAADYNRDPADGSDNIWTRWIRLKGTTQNFLGGKASFMIDEVNLDNVSNLNEPNDLAYSLDVDLGTVSLSSNKGVSVQSAGNEAAEEVLLDEEDL